MRGGLLHAQPAWCRAASFSRTRIVIEHDENNIGARNRDHNSNRWSLPGLTRQWRISGSARVPDAVRHSSCRSAEPGPYQTPEFATAPAQQRTATQVLRAALRPGRGDLQVLSANFKQPCAHVPAPPRELGFYLFLPSTHEGRRDAERRTLVTAAACFPDCRKTEAHGNASQRPTAAS